MNTNKIIKSENKLCLICMEKHDVQTVIVTEKETYKGEEVIFDAIYEYCDRANAYLETEDMIMKNRLSIERGKADG